MSFLFDDSYYRVGKNGVSPFQNMQFSSVSNRNACRRDDTSIVGARQEPTGTALTDAQADRPGRGFHALFATM